MSPELIGRFHPLLVHLPIGILLFAVGLMLFGWIKKVDVGVAVSLAWGLGALSALVACGAGWLLAQSGEYDAGTVEKHQWTGLLTAGLATVTFLSSRYRWLPAIVTVILLSVAGHYGGNLTHGEDYLFPDRAPQARTEPATLSTTEPVALRTDTVNHGREPIIRRTFLYRDQVVPILDAKCYSCHSASKKKGGLRLDSEAFIRQGGKNGSILTAGNPQKSKLFTYLLLPEGDDKHMPPKGKLQLTPQQVATIHHWIQKGASFKEQVDVIQPTATAQVATVIDEIPALPASLRPDSSNTNVAETLAQPAGVESIVLAKPVAAPDQATVDKLKQQQVALAKMLKGTNYLSANFVNVKIFEPALLDNLAEIGPQVVRLRLTDQPVTDADLKRLTVLKNLTRLNLEHTRITDTGLRDLLVLPNLEQLNLYGTAVTDSGLDALARYPNLKVVYLWQTQTTPAGIQRLQKARPDLKIEAGALQLARPDTNKTM